MTMQIRPAQLGDYDDFCELMAQIDKLHRDQHPEVFREAIPVRSLEYYTEILKDDNHHILLAEIDGKAVGAIEWLIVIGRDVPILQPRVSVVIDTLVVHDDYKRRGIGRKLMAEVEAWARTHKIMNIELGVWMFNEAAIKFYESLGYSIYRARMWHMLDE